MDNEPKLSKLLTSAIYHEFMEVGSEEEIMPLVLAIRKCVGERATALQKELKKRDEYDKQETT